MYQELWNEAEEWFIPSVYIFLASPGREIFLSGLITEVQPRISNEIHAEARDYEMPLCPLIQYRVRFLQTQPFPGIPAGYAASIPKRPFSCEGVGGQP